MTKLKYNRPKNAERTFLFAHGAGAGMDSDFMEFFAKGLAKANIRVARFEFPYMAERRKTGKSKPPNKAEILLDCFRSAIEKVGTEQLFIGGKSMGGRMASMIADECGISGLICLGYPFHPLGKPEKLRTEHLEKLKTRTLILQGERDSMGNADEVSQYKLSKKIELEWLPDGDHSFKPRKSSGHSLEQNWGIAIEMMVKFIKR